MKESIVCNVVEVVGTFPVLLFCFVFFLHVKLVEAATVALSQDIHKSKASQNRTFIILAFLKQLRRPVVYLRIESGSSINVYKLDLIHYLVFGCIV